MTPQELVDELCDAVDNDDMCYRSYLVSEVEDLCAENAKLRELIADLWEYIHIGTVHDGQSLHDRTRELGVDA